MSPRFVAAAPATLRIVELDALTLVYHRASGITHVLASPAPELLAALVEPCDINGLLSKLAADYDLADAEPGALAERLAELEAVGLVSRV